MGRKIDFVLQYTEDKDAMAQAIIKSLFVEEVKDNKPCIIMFAGDSGTGKSHDSLNIAKRILRHEGLELKDFVNDVCIYTPLEYPTKMKALLEEQRLKKVIVMIIDEAREVVKASDWQSFVNITIADINATFRRIKPMIIIVNTQFIKDIDPKIRRTLTFYGECFRYRRHKAMMRLYKLWKDTYDLDNPKLKKRRIRGIVIKNGKRIIYSPKHLTFDRVDKETIDKYEEASYHAKKELINYKLQKLIDSMQREYKGLYTKVNAAVDYYSGDNRLYETVLERHRGKLRVNKNVQAFMGFDKEQVLEFQNKLIKRLSEKGLLNEKMEVSNALAKPETEPVLGN